MVSRFSQCKSVELMGCVDADTWKEPVPNKRAQSAAGLAMQDSSFATEVLFWHEELSCMADKMWLAGTWHGCLAMYLHLFPQPASFLWPVYISLLIQACLMLAWGIFVWCRQVREIWLRLYFAGDIHIYRWRWRATERSWWWDLSETLL